MRLARRTVTKPLDGQAEAPETAPVALEEASEDERERAETERQESLRELDSVSGLSDLPDLSDDEQETLRLLVTEPLPAVPPKPIPPEPPDDAEDSSVAAKAISKGIKKLPHISTKHPQPKKFFEYWTMLGKTPKYIERTMCFAYRMYPAINKYHCPQCWAMVPPPKNKHNQICHCDACGWHGQIFLFVDKYTEPFPQEELLYRLGVGDYKLRLNDQVLKETLCETVIETERDWNNYRPILDVRELDMADPKNATYIKQLKSWGDLPKDDEGEDMAGAGAAAGAAIETLVGAVERSNEKMADMAEKMAKGQTDKPTPTQDLSAKAGEKAMEIISTGIAMANGMVSDAQKKATELLAQKANPLEQLRETMKVVADIFPKPGADPQIALLLKRLEDQDARLAKVEADRIASAEARATAAENKIRELEQEIRNPKQPATPAKTFSEQLKDLASLKEVFADFLGIDTDKETKTDTDMPPVGKRSIIDYIPVIMQAGMGIMHQLATARYNEAIATGKSQAQPIAPLSPPVVAPDAVKAFQDISAAAGGGAGAAVTSGAPFDFIANLPAMQAPVLDSLNLPDDDHPGFIFAQKFIGWAGRLAYDAQREKGKTDLLQIFRGYHPIWSVMQQIPVKAEKFIDDFLAHDAIMKELEHEDEDDDGQGNGDED